MFKKSFSLVNFYSKRLMSVQRQLEFDWAKQEKWLLGPFEYVVNRPCKHHMMMASGFNQWLQVPEDKKQAVQKVAEHWINLHVLYDDIRDHSEYRYGGPSAIEEFGLGVTLSSVIIAQLIVQDQAAELGHPLALEVLMKRTRDVFHGEGIDVYWRHNCICPSEEAHLEMTKHKSGSYFQLPVDLLQLFSSNKKDYTELAIKIGIYYELVDDYYNLFERDALPKLALKQREDYKTCSDITEGKITMAVIHAMQFPDVVDELADIYKQRTRDPELKNRALTLLKKHGSDEYTKNKLKALNADIRAEIEQLGGNPILTEIMDNLSVAE